MNYDNIIISLGCYEYPTYVLNFNNYQDYYQENHIIILFITYLTAYFTCLYLSVMYCTYYNGI